MSTIQEAIEVPKTKNPKKNRFGRKTLNDSQRASVPGSETNQAQARENEFFVLDNQNKVFTHSAYSILNDNADLLQQSRSHGDIFIEWRNRNISKGTIFQVHKHILSARSSWFRENLKEGASCPDLLANSIQVEVNPVDGINFRFSDVQPSNPLEFEKIESPHFQEFIKFLYTADIDLNASNSQQFLLLAASFEVKSLEDKVIRSLGQRLESKDIDVEELVQWIRLAYENKLEKLRNSIKNNMKTYRKIFHHNDVWELLRNDQVCKEAAFLEVKADLFQFS